VDANCGKSGAAGWMMRVASLVLWFQMSVTIDEEEKLHKSIIVAGIEKTETYSR
jgi:hypothetical protein